MKNIKRFNLNSDYNNYIQSENIILPNVSLVKELSEVFYNPIVGDSDYDENQYEYVDLGLSVKWATCNVGASRPEEYGLYFAWGETEGYTAEQVGVYKLFSWYDYQFSINGSNSNFSKYNSTDGLTTLELTDDAAHVNMGGNWRMPTIAECQELLDNTTTAWTTVNGVDGMKFTSTKEGYTDKYIFVPAAGGCNNGSANSTGSYGYLWSSSLDSSSVARARNLYFSSSSARMYNYFRYYGFSVRGVLE